MPRRRRGLTLYPRSRARAPSQRARPVAHLGGLHRRRRPAQHARSRPPRRPARLPPLLGGRAPRHADARLREPGGPDRPDRRGHRAPPGRQRRGDAPPLQPAQRRRALQHPERAVSRPDRPRHRSCAGHGPADHARPPARPPAAGPGRLPGAAHRAARPFEDRLPADHPFARLAALPGGPHRPEVWLLGSSPQSAIWAGELGLPYSFADFINPGGAEIAARVPAPLPRDRPRRGPAGGRERDGDLRRDRRGGGAARGERPDGVLAPAHGPARAGAAGGQGAALPRDPREAAPEHLDGGP